MRKHYCVCIIILFYAAAILCQCCMGFFLLLPSERMRAVLHSIVRLNEVRSFFFVCIILVFRFEILGSA